MEIKTAEEYVVTRLMEADDKITELKDKNAILVERVKSLREDIEFLSQLAELRVSTTGELYISFDSVWNSTYADTSRKFEKVADILGIDISGRDSNEE